MKTEVAGAERIDRAAELLRRGEVVAFPTETVYGLGGDAFQPDAVKKIFEAKGRPQDNPLIVHIADMDFLPRIAAEVPDAAVKLFSVFSPGPLTIVLKKNPNLPLIVTAGLQTVGIRIPNNEIARELIRRSGTGIAAPSANTSSRISPSCAEHVLEDMDGKIPMILDGGRCEVGIESTVLDLTKDVPVILRPGAVTAEMLLPYLKEVKTHTGEVKVAEAPGMKYKHYAPTVECVLALNAESASEYAKRSGKRALVLGSEAFISKVTGADTESLGSTAREFNHNVYAALRNGEKNYELLIVEKFPETDENRGVMNRISKSSGGKTV